MELVRRFRLTVDEVDERLHDRIDPPVPAVQEIGIQIDRKIRGDPYEPAGCQGFSRDVFREEGDPISFPEDLNDRAGRA